MATTGDNDVVHRRDAFGLAVRHRLVVAIVVAAPEALILARRARVGRLAIVAHSAGIALGAEISLDAKPRDGRAVHGAHLREEEVRVPGLRELLVASEILALHRIRRRREDWWATLLRVRHKLALSVVTQRVIVEQAQEVAITKHAPSSMLADGYILAIVIPPE